MQRPRFPRKLLYISIILFVLGLIATRAIPMIWSEEELAKNVLLNAIPFVLIFVSILLLYIGVITYTMRVYSDKIGERVYSNIMRVIIAGILIGILGMFQPWARELYTLGFIILFFSTLTYILWSHVVPKHVAYRPEEAIVQ